MPGSGGEYHARAPEFYVSPAVDAEVAAALRTLWPWLWNYVGQQLGDSTRAGDLNDRVADQVSDFVRRHPGQVRSVIGVCRVAAINLIKSVRARDSRMEYRGLSRDLELSAPPATGSVDELEFQIWVDQILQRADHQMQVMWMLRVLGKPWRRVGKVFGFSAGQARHRFYRGLEKICGGQGDSR
jgi:DNA-directed RNA polymerase specialized sigma24 family protein